MNNDEYKVLLIVPRNELSIQQYGQENDLESHYYYGLLRVEGY
jgi:hypothetical protein